MAESKNRIVYIEPNSLPGKYAAAYSNGVNPDNITWNPEDYNISVDLQVIIPTREPRNDLDYEKNALFNPNYASYQSFFSGEDLNGNGMLTDDYTNISYEEIRINGAGSKESLGVTSINIKFDANLYPVVTMKFTDVRAASLMGPAEQAFEDKEDKSQQVCRNFFSSLFKFPYPLFNLTVKGIFGTRATFRLSVNDFKSSYNGDTGNFDVTVSFIGNMYGLYTDIPFRFLLAAPYIGVTGGGKNKYWTDQTSEGGRFFYNEHGKSGLPIITFLEYARDYREALSGEGGSYDDEPGIGGLTENTAKKQRLDSIKDSYVSFITANGALEESVSGAIWRVYEKKTTGGDDEEQSLIFFDEGIETMQFKDGKSEAVISAAKSIMSTCEKEGIAVPNIISKIAALDGKSNPSLSLSGPYIDGNGKLTTAGNSLRGMGSVIENLNDGVLGGKDLKNKYALHINESFIDTIDREIQKLEGEAETLKKKASEEMLERFKGAIGFEPTVENAFRMIFAHLDTFLHYFYECVDDIKISRKISQFSIKIENTDIDSPGQEDAFMPPFTAFYRESNNNGLPERYYPGDSGSNASLRGIREVKFVEDIFNGVNSISEIFNPREEDMNDSGESNGGESNEEAAETDNRKSFEQNFNPLSITDIFYEGRNPYDLLGPGWEDPDKLLYFFQARLFSAERTNYSTDISKIIEKEVSNLSSSAVYTKIIEKRDEYKNVKVCAENKKSGDKCDIELKRLSDRINSHVYRITKAVLDGPDVDGDSFFWDDNSNGFQNFFDLSSVYTEPAINSFREKLNVNYSTPLRVKFLGSNGKYAIPIPLSVFSDSNGRRIVPFYDINKGHEKGDVYDAKKHLIGKETFNFWYDKKKYNTLESTENSNVSKIKTNSDFDLESYVNDGDHEFGAWIPYIPPESYKKEDYENNNYFFSDEFWKESSDTYYHAAIFLGQLLGPCSELKLNAKYSNIDKIPKFAYLSYCAYIYGFMNNEKGKYKAALNKVSSIFSEGIISSITETKSESELKGLSDYFKNWVDSSFASIRQSLETEKKSENKINAQIGKNFKVRLFNPEGEFMRKLMNFYRETAIPIFITNTNAYKAKINTGGYTSNATTEPYRMANNIANDFLKAVYKSCKEKVEDNVQTSETNEDDSSYVNASDVKVDFSNASASQRNSLYYTLKNLYDRWISTYSKNQFVLNSPEQEEAAKRRRFVGTSDSNGATDNGIESEFNSFIYVDKFYNDISKKFIFNPTKLGELIEMEMDASTNHSIISFMSEFCRGNKLLFKCLPIRNSLYSLETIENMFTPMSPYSGKNRMSLGVGNTYVIMYTYEPSSKLALRNNRSEGVGFKNDSFEFVDASGSITHDAELLFGNPKNPDELNLSICGFSVTPNAQNQSYFTKVSIGMDNPKVTEQAIRNTLELAAIGKSGGVSTGNGAGQDIYSVYSQRSYDCRVDMLGCINVMPMMYFQLNNMPMFNGVYMITSVEHNIQNNTMTTSFVGQRQSRYLIPLDADIFNVAGLSEAVSDNINRMGKIDVPYSAGPHGVGEFGSFNGNDLIYPALGSQDKLERTFYVASAVKQMGYRYPNKKGAPIPYGNGDSYKICATAVKSFIWAGFNGYADENNTSKICNSGYVFGMIGDGYKTYSKLQEIGFRVVATNSDLLNGFEPDAGDVAIMDDGRTGHICMWSGYKWVSDYTQKNLWVYGIPRPTKSDKAVMLFRYWGNKDYETEKKFGE